LATSLSHVPIIDISGWYGSDVAARQTLARTVDDACRTWGFLVVAGHRIDPQLMRAVADVSRGFFDQPLEQKMLSDAVGRAGGRGYYRMESKSLARTLGDLKAPGDLRESFRVSVEPVAGDAYTTSPEAAGHFAPNPWPGEPAQMKTIWQQYFSACDALATDLMHICARALGLDETWFNDKINRAPSSLVAQNYPKLEKPPVPGQIRNGAHTDFGTLTLLMTEDKPGGLQVMGMDGAWHDIKPVPGAYIVNLGDMMAQWTNDRWRSTLHRVVNPPLEAGEAARRLSIVFFHTPNFDAMIECIPSCTDATRPPKYHSIRAGDHLAQKLRAVENITEKAS
jgi:isopenicillin N synthase-like dioxygenase